MDQGLHLADSRYKRLLNLVWQALSAAGSSVVVGGSVQEIRFAIGAGAAQSSAFTLPAGSVVIDAEVDVKTPYSPGATMQVGILGTPNLFMDTPDIVATSADLYAEHQDTVLAGPAKVLVTVAGAPVAGAGFCIVRFVQTPLT
jgi:hypothetical protein